MANIPEKIEINIFPDFRRRSTKAGIVRAVINSPNILFADEPKGALISVNTGQP